ncbi:LOW QUALITY PROTEIN: protein mono-ADP-ribosyltransferase TIPARP-like [Pelodytes ibericus]
MRPRGSRKRSEVAVEVTELDPTEEETAFRELESGIGPTHQVDGVQAQEICQEPLTFYDALKDQSYHTHQDDGIDICSHFLLGQCFFGPSCSQHHTVLPFTWQLRETLTQTWSSIKEGAQESLERLFSDPEVVQVVGIHNGLQLSIDFSTMMVYNTPVFDLIRRLSTSTLATVPFHTRYTYYYEEEDEKWVEYGQEFVKGIVAGQKDNSESILCSSLLYKYRLNLILMYQENLETRTIRRMRKRPVFRSPVMMTSELWDLYHQQYVFHTTIFPGQSHKNSTERQKYPETWDIKDTSLSHEIVPLRCELREFQRVYSYFHKTMPEFRYILLEVSRIQNYFQWEKYIRKRDYMSQRRIETKRYQMERHLFHGTDPSLVEAICNQNFDPRVSGKNATLYGQGCYFAKEASYSHRYATSDAGGHHFMFLAKVLVGRPTVGKSTYRRPPPINHGDPASPLYDSCVSRANNPDIFVIFDNDQFYPYFLIKYQKMQGVVLLD